MKRPDCNDFLNLFLSDAPMIDTRAPVEFAKGAFPTSLSLPLMTDSERERVGTCYKQKGQDEAIKLGHQLVNGEIKEQRVKAWVDFANANPNGYLYCWRGGLRSQICQQWMAEAGCEYPRIKGGYKAMRTYLLDHFERQVASQPLLILAGKTGCNKTGLLQQVSNSVDLEGLAHHRGSAFGKRPAGQPSQLDFENALAIAMLKFQHSDAGRAGLSLVLEDESQLIGRCSLPHILRAAMNRSPLVVLESTLEERVEHSFRNYILNKLEEWQQQPGLEDPFAAFANDLRDSLQRVHKRLGGVRFQEVSAMLEAALDAHRLGDPHQHRIWIEALLNDYYDPMYDYQLSKHSHRICFRGNREEVQARLQSGKQPSFA